MAKYTNYTNNGTREVKFSLLDGGQYGEHSGVGFIKSYQIFATHDKLVSETMSFNGIWPRGTRCSAGGKFQKHEIPIPSRHKMKDY